MLTSMLTSTSLSLTDNDVDVDVPPTDGQTEHAHGIKMMNWAAVYRQAIFLRLVFSWTQHSFT